MLPALEPTVSQPSSTGKQCRLVFTCLLIELPLSLAGSVSEASNLPAALESTVSQPSKIGNRSTKSCDFS